MPALSTVEAQLSLHKRNIAKAAPGNGKKPAVTCKYEQAKVRNVLLLQYSVSYKRVTAPARHQSASR